MIGKVIDYIAACVAWLPPILAVPLIGFVFILVINAILGIISRIWRLIGR